MALGCGRFYNETSLKGMFIAGLHPSNYLSTRNQWIANKEITVQNLVCYATFLLKLQEGCNSSGITSQADKRGRQGPLRNNN